MVSLKEKVYDWRNRLRDRHMFTLVVTLISIIIILGLFIYKKSRDYRQMSENDYNMAFYELVDYVQSVETYLAKSLISSSSEQGAETLTHVWREADLTQSYLARLPIGSQELANTSKFLNQVSDYSFSLSRKNIYNENLTQEDFDNLEQLHNYSIDLANTLNQLSNDMNEGRIKWGELTKKGSTVFATQVSNISKDSFNALEENFDKYSGLIYDGAFSEHLTSVEKKGLTGEDVTEEQAKQTAIDFVGQDRIKEMTSDGISQNSEIASYNFTIKLNNDKDDLVSISVTQKGAHVISMNYDRTVEEQTISNERANEIGREFLTSKGFANMKETYYLNQQGALTINYAYNQETQNGNVVMYPDLIKLKIALDNGEILGIETTGYLNSHYERQLPDVKVSKQQAKQSLNSKIEIASEGFAVIPTDYKTEIFCYEFKGKINDTEFLVYINAETGKEEDILVIKNTPNGTLTM